MTAITQEESSSTKSWAAAGFVLTCSGKERKIPAAEVAVQPKDEAAPEDSTPQLRGYCRKTHTDAEWDGDGSLRWLVVDGFKVKSYEDHYMKQQSCEFDLRDVTGLRPSQDEAAPVGAVDFVIRSKVLTMLLPGRLGHCSAGDWLRHLASAVPEDAIGAADADDAFILSQRSSSMAAKLKKAQPPRHALRARPYLMRFARKRG